MAIEQVLMRAMKCVGGLTHGRSVSDSVVTKWVLTAPATAHIVNSLGKFCNVSFTSSEQHIELSKSRKQRDNDDIKKKYWIGWQYTTLFQSIITLQVLLPE
jgi:hypothetical protein